MSAWSVLGACVKSRNTPSNSDPPKSGKSWKLGSTAVTFGLTVPEFPLSSASPAMTDCVVVGDAGGPFSPMLSVSSAAE